MLKFCSACCMGKQACQCRFMALYSWVTGAQYYIHRSVIGFNRHFWYTDALQQWNEMGAVKVRKIIFDLCPSNCRFWPLLMVQQIFSRLCNPWVELLTPNPFSHMSCSPISHCFSSGVSVHLYTWRYLYFPPLFDSSLVAIVNGTLFCEHTYISAITMDVCCVICYTLFNLFK